MESVEAALVKFGQRVKSQLTELFRYYTTENSEGGFKVSNLPGEAESIRPWCDLVEIASMFDTFPEGLELEQIATKLSAFQDRVSGLTPPLHDRDSYFKQDIRKLCRYDTMITSYSLECLGKSPRYPITQDYMITSDELPGVLESLPWNTNAWGAGHWIDCYVSCLYINQRHFGLDSKIDKIIRWLDNNICQTSGMWGKSNNESRWLLPVNGFYRLTRGTYAQFDYPLPYPEEALDTVLEHSNDPEFFKLEKLNACNLLDVIHPLWLCGKQTDHRLEERKELSHSLIVPIISNWKNEKGFDFDLSGPQASLMGTEMWLSIMFLIAETLGLSECLGYRPKGVHRTEVAI